MAEKPIIKNPDGVKFSEITSILEEEGFFTPEVLSPDMTFGQARGVAGRKRTHVMKRLTSLGFVEAQPGVEGVAAKGKVTIKCDVLVLVSVPIVYCHIEIEMGTESKA